MVHFPRPAKPKSPANTTYQDSTPAHERVRQDLFVRWHKNTIQRDLLDQGLYVASDTGSPVTNYHQTQGNWDGVALPCATDNPTQLRSDLVDHGFCIVKDALSPDQLCRLQTRLDEQLAGEHAAGLVGKFPQTVFLGSLCNKGECFRQCVELSEDGVCKGALIEKLVTEMLGAGWLLNSLAAGVAGKGGIPQALHCGQSMIPKPWPQWPYECFVGFLLDDFSQENGGTLLVPGSHKIVTEVCEGPLPPLPPTYNVVAPAGSVLIFPGTMVHGTGVNHTDLPRRLIIMTVHKSFLRTQDTYGTSLDRSVYEKASPKLLERLGFTVETNTGFNGVEGRLAPGTIAPLRDHYLPVGELNEESGKRAASTLYSVRSKARYVSKM